MRCVQIKGAKMGARREEKEKRERKKKKRELKKMKTKTVGRPEKKVEKLKEGDRSYRTLR